MDRKLWPPLESHPLSSAFIDAIENTHPSVPALSVKPEQTFLPRAKTDGRRTYFVRCCWSFCYEEEWGGEIDGNHPKWGWIVFFLFISLEDYRVLSDECFPSVRPSSPCSRELSFGVLCLLCCAKTKAGVSVQMETGPALAFVCGAEIGIALQRQSACRFPKRTEVFFFSLVFFFYSFF
jgi:hypothetical protein